MAVACPGRKNGLVLVDAQGAIKSLHQFVADSAGQIKQYMASGRGKCQIISVSGVGYAFVLTQLMQSRIEAAHDKIGYTRRAGCTDTEHPAAAHGSARCPEKQFLDFRLFLQQWHCEAMAPLFPEDRRCDGMKKAVQVHFQQIRIADMEAGIKFDARALLI